MAYNYGSGVNPVGGTLRGQNIGVNEGALNRTHAEQLAAQQADIQREQMAQEYKMYEGDVDWREKMAQEAAEQAKQDRLYGLFGNIAEAPFSLAGPILGAGLGKEGFLRSKEKGGGL